MIQLLGIRNLYIQTSVKTRLISFLAFHSEVSYYCGICLLPRSPLSNLEGPDFLLEHSNLSNIEQTWRDVTSICGCSFTEKLCFQINLSHSHLFFSQLLKESLRKFYFILLSRRTKSLPDFSANSHLLPTCDGGKHYWLGIFRPF